MFQRILLLHPASYAPNYGWFERDLGLIGEGLRSFNIDAPLGVFSSAKMPNDSRLLALSPQEVVSETWWRNSGFTHAFLLTSARRVYEPIVQAAKSAGVFIAIRMDSDGWQSPRQAFWKYLSDQIQSNADGGKRFGFLYAVAKTTAFRMFPAIADRVWLKQFEMADIICIESEVAAARLRNFFQLWERGDLSPKVKVLASPVSEFFLKQGRLKRTNCVLAVGRWQHRQKNAPLLVSSLAGFLNQRSDWHAEIAGPGGEMIERFLRELKPPNGVRERLHIKGFVGHQSLPERFASGKIIFSTSKAEGFPNSIAEAMCQGCSLVGPNHIASMHYFSSEKSGTLYEGMRPRNAVEALLQEASKWDADPERGAQISSFFSTELSPKSVAKRFIELLPPQNSTS